MANPLQQLAALGQSVWLDYIHRDLFQGQLARLIEEDALSGMTSNPSIFEKAIDRGGSYDAQIAELAAEGHDARAIYEALSRYDVQHAADALRAVYERTEGNDGYVSLEVNPHLARDTDGTIGEARRLWAALARPNTYIKVPATREGLRAIRDLTAEGINVNITLLFSLPRYQEVMEAYLAGLEKYASGGGSLRSLSSVASFFVSRIDSMVDPMLESRGAEAARARGRVAVACAKLAYEMHGRFFAQERFRRLIARGARPQRLLWASTSTKNPSYSDIKYVEELLGADTINTMPLETIAAYRDHGHPQLRLGTGLVEARELFEGLPALGIDMDSVGRRLEEQGIEKFNEPFDTLLDHIEAKRQRAAPAPSARTAERAPPAPR